MAFHKSIEEIYNRSKQTIKNNKGEYITLNPTHFNALLILGYKGRSINFNPKN